MIEGLLPNYPRIVVWFDDVTKGQQFADWVTEQIPFRKEKVRIISHARDANELLVAGELAAFVQMWT